MPAQRSSRSLRGEPPHPPSLASSRPRLSGGRGGDSSPQTPPLSNQNTKHNTTSGFCYPECRLFSLILGRGWGSADAMRRAIQA
eukprot:3313089-Rhodomonas_salina.2